MGTFQILALISFLATVYACTENDIQPIEGSCSKYTVCRNGNLKIEKCPFGNQFNINSKKCEIFFNVNCTEGIECEDGLLYKHENPSAYYTCLNGRLRLEFCPLNQKFNGEICTETKKIDNSLLFLKKTRNCKNGDKKPANDCQKFIECVDGDWVNKSCPPKQAFDITRKICKFIWEASCSETSCIEGYMYPVQNSQQSYTQCENHKRVIKQCFPFHIYDNKKHDCVLSLLPKSYFTIFKQECQNGGKQVDGLNSFLYCKSGDWEKFECPNGEIFDSINLECTKCKEGDISSSSCDSYEICESGVLKKYICNTGASFDGSKCVFGYKCRQNRHKREVNDKKCIDGGRQPSENSTSEYQVCQNGKWTIANCGAHEVFDVNTLSCKAEGDCKKGEKMIKHGFCKKFLLCKNGKWADGTCPKKHIFDGFQCVENSICNRYSTVKNECAKYKDNIDKKIYSCPNGFRFDKVIKECVYFAEARCDTDRQNCYGNEKQGDPKDCSKYKECVNGYYVDKSCSSWKNGWLYKFDAIKQKCVFRTCVDCTPTLEIENLLLKNVCEEGTTESVENTCRLYRVCKNGEWITEKCSPCKRFDQNINGCVRVWTEPCPQGVTDPPITYPSWDPTGTWDPTRTSVIPSSTHKPRHCKEGDRRGDVSNCKKYKECIDGDWEDKSCSLWGKFDTVTNQCLYLTAWKAKCA